MTQASLFDDGELGPYGDYEGLNYVCEHNSGQISSAYIGQTKHRKDRARAHARHGVDRTMLAWWPGDEQTERSLHLALGRYRDRETGRDWFHMTRESVDVIAKVVEKWDRLGCVQVIPAMRTTRQFLFRLDDMAERWDYRNADRQPITGYTEWDIAEAEAAIIRKDSQRNTRKDSARNP